MAKTLLKRPAKKAPAKLASKKTSKVVSKATSKTPAKKATRLKSPSKIAAPKAKAKPAQPKAITAKASVAKNLKAATKASSKSLALTKTPKATPLKTNGSPKTDLSKAKPAAKDAAKIPASGKIPPVANGKAPANGKASPTIEVKPAATKSMNGSKPANGSAAPAEAPKPSGRPMLTQGPVASKSLTKKGTFVLVKPTVPVAKPIKRKIDRPEPAFVTLQPPVPQVKTSEKAVKNRAGFNQRDLDFFRDLLLQKRRELVGDMSHMEREALRENNANLASPPTQTEEQGTDAYEQEFTLGLVEKDRTLLREINDAMAKIQNGSYGICEGTGNPISRARLEAQPWARHSIEFARILEKRKMVFRR